MSRARAKRERSSRDGAVGSPKELQSNAGASGTRPDGGTTGDGAGRGTGAGSEGGTESRPEAEPPETRRVESRVRVEAGEEEIEWARRADDGEPTSATLDPDPSGRSPTTSGRRRKDEDAERERSLDAFRADRLATTFLWCKAKDWRKAGSQRPQTPQEMSTPLQSTPRHEAQRS